MSAHRADCQFGQLPLGLGRQRAAVARRRHGNVGVVRAQDLGQSGTEFGEEFGRRRIALLLFGGHFRRDYGRDAASQVGRDGRRSPEELVEATRFRRQILQSSDERRFTLACAPLERCRALLGRYSLSERNVTPLLDVCTVRH